VNVQGTVNPSTKGGRVGIASWAQLAARGGMIPPSLAKSRGSSSVGSRGVPTWELSQDREVIVKLRDPAIVKKYREIELTAIRQAADRVLKAATKECPTLQAVQIVASRQLRSGDLSISVRDANQAELLRRHASQWVRGFGKEAMVRMPTWGVVVGDISVKSINLSDQKAVISELLAENAFIWDKQAEITQVRWLQYSTNPPVNKPNTSIVIEFTTPEAANTAVEQGTVWKAVVHQTTRYIREARIKQCFNCQQFGHMANQCQNETVCKYCAKKRESRNCPKVLGDDVEVRCANCKGEHPSFHKECDIYQEHRRGQILSYKTRNASTGCQRE
jgi:hypothetical protein